MKYKNILLTGGSGKLGQAIIKSGIFPSVLAPSRDVLDITKPETIEQFFKENEIDAVIHCAALARMAECEEEPIKAIEANIEGASNLINAVLKCQKYPVDLTDQRNISEHAQELPVIDGRFLTREKESKKSVRFVHISTDYVYPGTKGNYSEEDETIPFNNYGWAKLGAECAVNLLSNFCIIRTSFFDPENIKFDCSANDAYSSKVPMGYLVKAIAKMLESDFIGIINIGSDRKSDYERYKEFKPSLKECKLKDILGNVPFQMAKDASMNCELWKKIEKKIQNKNE